MKKLIHTVSLAALFCGCATTATMSEAELAKLAHDKQADPYRIGMASIPGDPMAAEWQNMVNGELMAAMKPEELKVFVEDDSAMKYLLAQVKCAYRTDAMAATKIAAISQLVMCPKCDKAPKCRDKWSAALLKAAEESECEYRTLFLLDQLRWCGRRNQAGAIRALGERSELKSVRDFAFQVAKGLEK